MELAFKRRVRAAAPSLEAMEKETGFENSTHETLGVECVLFHTSTTRILESGFFYF